MDYLDEDWSDWVAKTDAVLAGHPDPARHFGAQVPDEVMLRGPSLYAGDIGVRIERPEGIIGAVRSEN